MKRTHIAVTAMILLGTAAPLASAGPTVGVTVGADQSVTNTGQVTAPFGVQFTGDGGTFTNNQGATIEATSNIAIGPSTDHRGISVSGVTITNAGTLQQDGACNVPTSGSNCGSGMFFSNVVTFTSDPNVPNVTTGAPVSNITINNQATGVIKSLNTAPNSDSRPISFEAGVDGAAVNNGGLISTIGQSTTSTALHVGDGATNVTITNQVNGTIANEGSGAGIRLDNEGNPANGNTSASNVAIVNSGTIVGGTNNVPNGSIGAAIVLTNGGSDIDGNPVPNPQITGVTINNAATGMIDGSKSAIAIDNSRNSGALSITNSGTIKGNVLFGSGGDTLTLTGGTVQTPNLAITGGATLRGTGTIQGNVTVNSGSTVNVGGSPDALHVAGNYTQTGGTLKFEIDQTGKVFLTSTLVLGDLDTATVNGTQIDFDFVGGADPTAFAPEFNIDTFFKTEDGGAPFLALTNDIFIANDNGIDTILALSADGSLTPASVPEPASIALFGTALAGLGMMRRRERMQRFVVALLQPSVKAQ